MTLLASPALAASLLAATAACTHQPASHIATTQNHGAAMAVVADPKLIDMAVEATTSAIPASATSELGVRVRISARNLPAARRPPLDLALVLDTSGSMESQAIDAVRSSAHELAHKLRDGDRISVIAFHSRADVLVPATLVDAAARLRIDAAIDKITARGTTDLAGGLGAGLQQLSASQFPQGINRIVLLSDGVPNTSAQLPALVAGVHHSGFSVTTLGLGVDYDTTFMTAMARETGGDFHFIEKPEQVAAVFDDELTKMTTVVGRNLQLVLAPGPGVTIKPMPGLTAGADGTMTATIGDLPAGETRDLMIPIMVTARGDGATAELVEATLGFDDVIEHSGHQQREGFVATKASLDPVTVKAGVKIVLEVARVRASAAGDLLEALAMARSGQIEPARKRLVASAQVVRAAATRFHDSELAAIGEQLEEVSKELAQLVMPPPPVAQPVKAPMQPPMTVEGAAGVTPSPAATPEPAVAPAAVEVRLRHAQDKANADLRGRKH